LLSNLIKLFSNYKYAKKTGIEWTLAFPAAPYNTQE